MKITVKATRKGRMRFGCKSFLLGEKDAEIYKRLGLAKDMPKPKEEAVVKPKTKRTYNRRDMQAVEPTRSDPFDHDGDGRPGGSAKVEDVDGELSNLRSEYQTTVGKRPFYGWDADTLRQKIAEAKNGA
jgi:hypothetical protein